LFLPYCEAYPSGLTAGTVSFLSFDQSVYIHVLSTVMSQVSTLHIMEGSCVSTQIT